MKTTPAHDPEGRDDADERPLMFAVRAWDRFWFKPADPTSLGLIRLCVGLIVLYIHIVYSFGLTGYVGPDSWIVNTGWSNKPGESGVMDFVRNGNTMQGPSPTWNDGEGEVFKGQTIWSIYFHVEDPTWVWVIHISILVSMFLFTIGLWTRVTSALAWIGALMYIQRLPGLLFGMDTMTNLALLYLMISPCGAALSLDRWLKVRRERLRLGPAYVPQPPEPLVSANFALRLMQINFCFIYFAAGTSKLLGTSWWNATAPDRVLLNYSFAPFEVGAYLRGITWLSKHRWLWEIIMSTGVVFTLILELGFPFMVWNRRLRWVMVGSSILMHTMIGLFMGLVTFSLVMLALVLSFVPPEVVRQGLQIFGQQLWQVFLIVSGSRRRAEPGMALSR
jgi:hypothetical protein